MIFSGDAIDILTELKFTGAFALEKKLKSSSTAHPYFFIF